MKRSRLIRAAAFAAALAGLGAVVALLSQARLAEQQTRHREALMLRTDLAQRLQREENARAKRERLTAELARLAARDAAEPNWAEQLARIQHRMKASGVEFAASAPAGKLLVTQTLAFSARLRHEGEFLDLIAALQAHATVRARQCALRRSSDASGLEARCTLERVALSMEASR